MNVWHATDVTWPFPTYSNNIWPFLIDFPISWSIIQFYCTRLLCHHLIVTKLQDHNALGNFNNWTFHYRAHQPANTLETVRMHQYSQSGITSLVIWSYHKVTWSQNTFKLVILLLDIVQLLTTKACYFVAMSIPIQDMMGTPLEAHKWWKTFIYSVLKRLAWANHPKTQYLPFWTSKIWPSPQTIS